MKILTGWSRLVTLGTTLLALSGTAARTQRNGPPQLPSSTQATDPFGAENQKMKGGDISIGPSTAKLNEMRNIERQKRLVSDTERLLALATQLHQDVEKTDQHILSMDVVKRAEEIEKLAHSVKERMKG